MVVVFVDGVGVDAGGEFEFFAVEKFLLALCYCNKLKENSFSCEFNEFSLFQNAQHLFIY